MFSLFDAADPSTDAIAGPRAEPTAGTTSESVDTASCDATAGVEGATR